MSRTPVALSLTTRTLRLLRTGPLFAWRFAGPVPDRIAHTVPDYFPGEPNKAREIYLGRFILAGSDIDVGGALPFTVSAPPGWTMALHGFSWLRDMEANGEDLASANARAMIIDWATLCSDQMRSAPWDPLVTATRLISFLRHTEFILKGGDHAFYRKFCTLIVRHTRYLRAVANGLADSTEKLRIRLVLAIAAFAVPLSANFRKRSLERLNRLIDQQVLPDGGHVSRNPDVLAHLLHDLLSLRDLLTEISEPVPDCVRRAIDRMFPALRAMLHADGSLASFNGGGLIRRDALNALLAHDTTQGGAAPLASHSGYWHATQGATTLITDVGLPPAPGFDEASHAGLTAFEMSSDGHRFIINAGADPTFSSAMAPVIRASAAHSMAVVGDHSLARFTSRTLNHERFVTAMIDGPKSRTSSPWNEDGWTGWRCGHDGFDAAGLSHERGIRLSDDGMTIEGFDRVSPLGNTQTRIDIRFHLHPDVVVRAGETAESVVFWHKHSAGFGWTLTVPGQALEIEDSIRFSHDAGRQPTKAVSLFLTVDDAKIVMWRLRKSYG